MGAAHTYFENVKNLSLRTLLAAATGVSASIPTNLSRANAIIVEAGAFTFTGTNKLTFNLEDSDDDSNFDTVVNGANLGEEVNVIWGNMTDDEELTASTDPSTTLNGATLTLDATDNDDKVYIAEYKGSRAFVRLNIVEGGTVTAILAVQSGQNALRDVPNIVPIGDNS